MTTKTNKKKNHKHENIIESLGNEISDISNTLKYSASVQLIYTGSLLNKYVDLMLSRLNLSGPRIEVILTLIVHGGVLRQKELTRLLFRTKQNISGIIDGLVKNGLVSKQLDVKDRRSFRIVITRKGLDLARTSLPIIGETFASSLGALHEEEIQKLKTGLATIRKTIYKQLADFAEGRSAGLKEGIN
jgi:DNA-binding MarR family transcriptional regulator